MILQEIAERTRVRIEEQKKQRPMAEVEAAARAMDANTGFPFEQALKGRDVSFICEVKKASPSKGLISPISPLRRITKRRARPRFRC